MNYIRFVASRSFNGWAEQQSNYSANGAGADDIVYQFCTCATLAACQHSGSAVPTN